MNAEALRQLLDEKAARYNRLEFIATDPVSIPHRFSKKQDIEIAAFFAATLAWGNRTTIIKSCNRLLQLMDQAPHDFVLHHSDHDLKPLLEFRHRTFNDTDLLYFISFFKNFYSRTDSLEQAFASFLAPGAENSEAALIGFRRLFFSLPDVPQRSLKHVATPEKNSSCKRLNMFLRWMVRDDECGVDFGLWKKISPSQLVCPCDVHVDRVARMLGLITSAQTNWKTALELTERLKEFDASDPVKYDYALFGLGVMEHYGSGVQKNRFKA